MTLFSDRNILILPGNGSGPMHWQSLWEKEDPNFRRVEAIDWGHPDLGQWVASLEAAVQKAGPRTVLVAHSLGCLQASHWAAQTSLAIEGALLVAPPNSQRDAFPKEAVSFRGVPQKKFSFKSCLISSSNDPYCDIAYAEACAQNWESRFINIGPAGHINASSRLGDWPEGLQFLRSLITKE
jgi:predicted alpha/beta hydrolase family esterase